VSFDHYNIKRGGHTWPADKGSSPRRFQTALNYQSNGKLVGVVLGRWGVCFPGILRAQADNNPCRALPIPADWAPFVNEGPEPFQRGAETRRQGNFKRRPGRPWAGPHGPKLLVRDDTKLNPQEGGGPRTIELIEKDRGPTSSFGSVSSAVQLSGE
jgi:hypothetical protein